MRGMSRFAAPRDRVVRVVSGLTSVAMVAGAAVLVASAPDEPGSSLVRRALAAAILLGLLLAWALAPTGFAIEGGAVTVERRLLRVRLPLASIRAVAPLGPRAISGALRLAGSGGLFGFYGAYRSRELGAFRLYASRRDGLVLLDTARGRFVVSPEPPARFVEELRGRAGLPASAPSVIPVPDEPPAPPPG
jgi:hypothetical protein